MREMCKMKNINKKIFFLLLIFLVAFIGLKVNVVYASSETEELKELLSENEENLGNLQQFKEVIDGIYNDLNEVTEVDEAFREKLKSDIDKLDNVDGINPLFKSVLDIELKAQADNLTNENIGEMREEILAMKEWTDDKVKDDVSNENVVDKENNIVQTTQKNVTIDQSLSNQSLPKAGIKNINDIKVKSKLIIPKKPIGLYSLNKTAIVFRTFIPSLYVLSFDTEPSGLSR